MARVRVSSSARLAGTIFFTRLDCPAARTRQGLLG